MSVPLQAFRPHKLTVDDMLAMSRNGLLDHVEKVELIDGVLIEMPAEGGRRKAVEPPAITCRS